LPEPSRVVNRLAPLALLSAVLSVGCAAAAMGMAASWLLVPYALFTAGALGGAVVAWGRATRQAGGWRGRLLAGTAAALVFAFYAGAMYATAYLNAEERIERSLSADRLTVLAKRMRAYQTVHGRLPPPAIRDPNGKALLSWRVTLLPYFGEKALFERFHLDEAWDSPHNRALLAEMPSIFVAAHRHEVQPPSTVFQVVVGPGTPFDPAGPLLRFDGTDFPGGPRELFLIVEAARPVPWTSPEDLPYVSDRPLAMLGGVMKYVKPPVMFVPQRSDGALITQVGADAQWLDLDAIDEATLRRSIAQGDAE
jgi:hypothetical protein